MRVPARPRAAGCDSDTVHLVCGGAVVSSEMGATEAEEGHSPADDRRSALDCVLLGVGIAVAILLARKADAHMAWILAFVIGIAAGLLVASVLGSLARWYERA